MKTVAVFFGGVSNEHEISVITGMYAVNLLRSAGYRVLPVYLPVSGGMTCSEKVKGIEEFRTPPSFPPVELRQGRLVEAKSPKRGIKLDCALNCCHGGGGEGGVLAALLEWYGIPSASPRMAESAVFLDKSLAKLVLIGLGMPVVPSFDVREEDGDVWKLRAAELGYPVIVKPCKLGSSIGVTVAHGEEELSRALSLSFRLDGAALVEKYLAGKRDLNCAAYRLGEKIVLSEVEEVFSGEPILTFGEKYEGTSDRRASKLPADLPEALSSRVKELLACAYRRLGMRGVVRADFLLDGDALYFNELNTVPGTLAAYLFGDTVTQARDFVVSLVEEAKLPKRREVLSSGILSSPVFGGKSRKRR